MPEVTQPGGSRLGLLEAWLWAQGGQLGVQSGPMGSWAPAAGGRLVSQIRAPHPGPLLALALLDTQDHGLRSLRRLAQGYLGRGGVWGLLTLGLQGARAQALPSWHHQPPRTLSASHRPPLHALWAFLLHSCGWALREGTGSQQVTRGAQLSLASHWLQDPRQAAS